MQHVLDAAAVESITGTDGVERTIPGNMKLALMAICDDASDHTNLSWPGQEKIRQWSVVSERQSIRLVTALVEVGLVERVSGASRGRRAVYRVKVPPRPRMPVDNPKIKGDTDVTQSRERVTSSVAMGGVGVTPLRINSPNYNSQIVTETALEAAGDNSTIRPESIEGEHKRIWPIRLMKGSRRKKLDLELLTDMVAACFVEIRQEYPKTWTDHLDQLAAGILHRGRRSEISDETKYVHAAIVNDLEMFRTEMWSRLGGAHARTR
jgi:hypothetical protein